MVDQGFQVGDCLVEMPTGVHQRACRATLRFKEGDFSRLIKSVHLSRPEHYLSIYQSGCNHNCRKCHSWSFSKKYLGSWITTNKLADIAHAYERHVTVWEPRERATMFHGAAMCRGCGACVLHGERSPRCPGTLQADQVVLSPQGFGPARNIVAFTGGDISCRADYYAQTAERIKDQTENIWVLLETNGWGLTPTNLDRLAAGGVDSFWLDIKAYEPAVYRQLCGTDNVTVLSAPAEILARGFTLEVLALFIPGWVENEQIKAIASRISELDPELPFTLLAFFPEYRLSSTPRPTLTQMVAAYRAVREVGLRQVRLGNCHLFARTDEEWQELLDSVGAEALG